MIIAKVINYDTNYTRLKVTLLTEHNEQMECWVMDNLVSKIYNEEYSLELHEFHIAESDGHKYITSIL